MDVHTICRVGPGSNVAISCAGLASNGVDQLPRGGLRNGQWRRPEIRRTCRDNKRWLGRSSLTSLKSLSSCACTGANLSNCALQSGSDPNSGHCSFSRSQGFSKLYIAVAFLRIPQHPPCFEIAISNLQWLIATSPCTFPLEAVGAIFYVLRWAWIVGEE